MLALEVTPSAHVVVVIRAGNAQLIPPTIMDPLSTSVTIEPLSKAIALTDTYAETTNYARVDSRSQIHFFLDYDPHTNNLADDTVEMQVQILYVDASQPADYEQASGGSNSFTWKTHCEERDEGDNSSTFHIRTWRVNATATENADRDPDFSRPKGVKAVKLQVKEVNAGTDVGSYSAYVSAQRI